MPAFVACLTEADEINDLLRDDVYSALYNLHIPMAFGVGMAPRRVQKTPLRGIPGVRNGKKKFKLMLESFELPPKKEVEICDHFWLSLRAINLILSALLL